MAKKNQRQNRDILQISAGRPLALYGLAANPPHRGHWSCVRDLAARGYFVLVAPSFAHAFGKNMAPFELRSRWLREAGAEFGALGDHARVWEEEREAAAGRPAGSPVYSIEMLERALELFGRPPRLAMGPDNLDPMVFARFHQSERIASDFGLVALAESEAVRSTQIRAALAAGEAGGEFLSHSVGRAIAASVADFFSPQR